MVRKTTASKLAVDKSQKRRLLKVASYNINGINSRLPVLLRWLEEFRPHVVGLQELKCTDETFPAKDIEALGYSAIWHGQKSWNGVAILSRVGEPVETGRGLVTVAPTPPFVIFVGMEFGATTAIIGRPDERIAAKLLVALTRAVKFAAVFTDCR